jgi:hypothetical protein
MSCLEESLVVLKIYTIAPMVAIAKSVYPPLRNMTTRTDNDGIK